jgi:hypothetical protein
MNALQAPTGTASLIQLLGAGGFGLLIGWYIYMINRYRRGDVQLSDLVTLIGVIGGTAVLAIFPSGTDLFGAYGVGLAVGFFLYFLVLLILVAVSPNKEFNTDWFLDGRCKLPGQGFGYSGKGGTPMQMTPPTVPPPQALPPQPGPGGGGGNP